MTISSEEQNAILCLVGAVFAIVSVRKTACAIPALIGLWLAGVSPWLVLMYGVSLSLVLRARLPRLPLRTWLALGLLGLLLAANARLATDGPALLLLPFAFLLPVLCILDGNSSGTLVTIPLALCGLVDMLVNGVSAHSAVFFSLMCLYHAWYRQLPRHLALLLMALAAWPCLALVQAGDVRTPLLLLAGLALHLAEKSSWARHRCLATPLAWSAVSLVGLALVLNPAGRVPALHTVLAYLLMVLAQVEGCRICALSLRCREFTLSAFGRGLVGFYAVLLCLGETPASLHVLWLALVWLCLEASELKTLQPLRADMLPPNPCKAETLGA